MQPTEITTRGLDMLQKISMSLMAVLVLITFIGTNLQAVLWQSSEWLVSTVLPAVIIDLTNQERADNTELPLQHNAVLDAAAKLKAEDMAKNQYFAHFSPMGVSPWHWFDEAGYVYAHAGENLAIHFTDSSEVVEAWMKSPAHRENIVSGKYTEIGVGTAKGKFDGYDTVYVVQLFGTPAIAPTPRVVAQPEPSLVEVAPAPVLATETVSLPVATATPAADVIVQTNAGEQNAFVSAETSEAALAADNQTNQGTKVPTGSPAPAAVLSNPVLVASADEAPVSPVEELLVVETEQPAPAPADVVVIESPIIATSSGLAVANITTINPPVSAGAKAASIATEPHTVLQILYSVLAGIVLVMLTISVVMESRRMHYRQVAYGFLLLFVMGGLWYVNVLLTGGAVIV